MPCAWLGLFRDVAEIHCWGAPYGPPSWISRGGLSNSDIYTSEYITVKSPPQEPDDFLAILKTLGRFLSAPYSKLSTKKRTKS